VEPSEPKLRCRVLALRRAELVGVLFTVLVLTAAFSAAGDQPSEEARPTTGPGGADDAMSRMCGPNCLLALLRLYGHPVTPSDMMRYYPLHPEGMSLMELRQASGELGLAGDVRLFEDRVLSGRLATPIIAHCRAKDSPRAGHYVVVTSAGERSVTFLDGTTGGTQTMSNEAFAEYWTGYALVPRRSLTGVPMSIVYASGVLLCLVLFLVARAVVRARKIQGQAVTGGRGAGAGSPGRPACSNSLTA